MLKLIYTYIYIYIYTYIFIYNLYLHASPSGLTMHNKAGLEAGSDRDGGGSGNINLKPNANSNRINEYKPSIRSKETEMKRDRDGHHSHNIHSNNIHSNNIHSNNIHSNNLHSNNLHSNNLHSNNNRNNIHSRDRSGISRPNSSKLPQRSNSNVPVSSANSRRVAPQYGGVSNNNSNPSSNNHNIGVLNKYSPSSNRIQSAVGGAQSKK